MKALSKESSYEDKEDSPDSQSIINSRVYNSKKRDDSPSRDIYAARNKFSESKVPQGK